LAQVLGLNGLEDALTIGRFIRAQFDDRPTDVRLSLVVRLPTETHNYEYREPRKWVCGWPNRAVKRNRGERNEA